MKSMSKRKAQKIAQVPPEATLLPYSPWLLLRLWLLHNEKLFQQLKVAVAVAVASTAAVHFSLMEVRHNFGQLLRLLGRVCRCAKIGKQFLIASILFVYI